MIGASIADWWVRISTDLGTLATAVRPYAGDLAQAGLSIVLGFANGLLELVAALLIAFFLLRDGADMAVALARAAA